MCCSEGQNYVHFSPVLSEGNQHSKLWAREPRGGAVGRVSPAVPRERFQQELLVESFCEAARLARRARPRWRLIRERRYHALAEPWVREPRSIAVNDVIKQLLVKEMEVLRRTSLSSSLILCLKFGSSIGDADTLMIALPGRPDG